MAVNLEHSCSEAKSPKKSTAKKKKSTTKRTNKAKPVNLKLSNTVTKDRKEKRKLTILPDKSIDDEEASLIAAEVFHDAHNLILFLNIDIICLQIKILCDNLTIFIVTM